MPTGGALIPTDLAVVRTVHFDVRVDPPKGRTIEGDAHGDVTVLEVVADLPRRDMQDVVPVVREVDLERRVPGGARTEIAGAVDGGRLIGRSGWRPGRLGMSHHTEWRRPENCAATRMAPSIYRQIEWTTHRVVHSLVSDDSFPQAGLHRPIQPPRRP